MTFGYYNFPPATEPVTVPQDDVVQMRSPDGKNQACLQGDQHYLRTLPPPIGSSGWEPVSAEKWHETTQAWQK